MIAQPEMILFSSRTFATLPQLASLREGRFTEPPLQLQAFPAPRISRRSRGPCLPLKTFAVLEFPLSSPERPCRTWSAVTVPYVSTMTQKRQTKESGSSGECQPSPPSGPAEPSRSRPTIWPAGTQVTPC